MDSVKRSFLPESKCAIDCIVKFHNRLLSAARNHVQRSSCVCSKLLAPIGRDIPRGAAYVRLTV
jgi:hypothetical protein